MGRMILKPEIVELIKKNQLTYGKLAYLLDVSISSMPRILAANKPELTEAAVLRMLKEDLKITKDSDLLIEAPTALAEA